MTRRLALATAAIAAISIVHVDALTVVPMTFEELVEGASAVRLRAGRRRARAMGVRSTGDRQLRDARSAALSQRRLRRHRPDAAARAANQAAWCRCCPARRCCGKAISSSSFSPRRGPAIPAPLGLGQGVFRVAHDGRTGQSIVSPPPLKSSDAGRVLRGAANRRVLTLDAFEANVRALGAAR